MPGYLICERRTLDHTWEIVSWDADSGDAIDEAKELLTPPNFSAAVCVMEVGGSDALPQFTVRFTKARAPQQEQP